MERTIAVNTAAPRRDGTGDQLHVGWGHRFLRISSESARMASSLKESVCFFHEVRAASVVDDRSNILAFSHVRRATRPRSVGSGVGLDPSVHCGSSK